MVGKPVAALEIAAKGRFTTCTRLLGCGTGAAGKGGQRRRRSPCLLGRCSSARSGASQVFRGQFSIVALALGNFIVGLSILLPTGMLAELSSNLGVTIGTVGLLISLGAAVV